ncbi:DUF6445 family protein [Asticcacaulis solisilvae]|uniref:DUF6445 family protein n=1 Tax=Asticcacaulis solisilvae TaxID=1217274 RepID=UPI003FD6F28B
MTETVLPALELNPRPPFERRMIGDENNIVLVVDDALLNPDALLRHAEQSAFAAPPPKSFYPGVIAPVPMTYLQLMAREMRQMMVQLFGMNPSSPAPTYGFFGLATVATDDFTPAQRAPHTDSARLNSFASVHYLTHAPFGGTAFYRHKATGCELITPIRSDKYARTRRQELAQTEGQPAAAVEAFYEEIGYVEPRFNRLVFYRAGQLHRSRLNNDAPLTADPKTGRLTANLFFNIESI